MMNHSALRLAATAAAAALPLAACVTVPPRPAIAAGPPFVADQFFTGRTEGTGTLRVAFKPAVTTIVHGSGRVVDGTLILDQSVTAGSKSPTMRQWRITTPTPGHLTGSLSDAVGPITGNETGNRLHITFAMKGGLHADQKLDLAADGQSAHNIMVITKFGITVASLDETIRRVS